MMPRSLSARIGERAARETPSRNAKNRAAFLAVRDDVKQALDDGWPRKAIWETLHEEGKIAFSYQAFRTYVNRLILEKRLETERGRVAGKEERGGKSDEGGVRPVDKNSTAGLPGFTFNSTPKKEDLI
jgi:hypothetical protein